MDPRPRAPRQSFDAARHWDRLAGAYARWLGGWPLGPVRRRAVALLSPSDGGRYLLVGCGPALEHDRFPLSARVIGLDLAPAMLRLARARLGRGAIVLADAQRLPLADGAFDGVLLSFICAVAPDGAAVLAEAVRVTRPGGAVVLADKLRRGPDTPLWRLLGRLTSRTGSDFNRSFEAVLSGRGEAVVTHDEPRLGRGYVSVVRLERPG